MKLEASTRLKLTAEHYSDYLHRLVTDLKIKHIGEGSYSHVFQHPTMKNIVVKLVRRDDQYLAFARLALANPKNPWLPRIAAIETIKFDDQHSQDNPYLVFMERLQVAPFDLQTDLIGALARTYNLELSRDSTYEWFTKSSWAKLTKESKDPGLAQFASFAVKNFKSLDLHRKNIMIRGKQLVFSDPVV